MYSKQWGKIGFLILYNLLSSIYLYIAVQKCHIRGKRDNNGEKIAQKEIANFNIWSVFTKE